jgi:hypothetical protein
VTVSIWKIRQTSRTSTKRLVTSTIRKQGMGLVLDRSLFEEVTHHDSSFLFPVEFNLMGLL